jgi:cytochrome c oxidase cbb3-type subunit 3
MKNSILLVVLAAAVCRVSLFAQDSAAAREQRPDMTTVSSGGMLFKQTCGFCHGPDGRGANGPDLIRSALVSHDVGGNLIGPVVHNGRPEKGMPAFPLTDIQIREIADYLHSEAKLASSVTQGIAAEYPLANLLIGNADAGRAYFNGKGKCAGCHSPSGDLAHIATKYKPLELQKRIAFPSSDVPTVIVVDGSGKRYSGDQVYADEFAISLRDRNGWIRSWTRSAVKVEIHDPLATHEALLTAYTDKAIHDLFAYLETLK